MVYLHNQIPSRKRPSPFVPPFPPKIPKSNPTQTLTASAAAAANASASRAESKIERMVTVLADAGCTLINPSGPPCLPSDMIKFRSRVERVLGCDDGLRSDFVQGLSEYFRTRDNFRRALMRSSRDGSHANYARTDSLVRNLLLVPSIQIDLQNMLLEMLPEFFNGNPGGQVLSCSFEDDIARLILNHFRWLDFLVDSSAFTDKLLQVLCICPSYLKKEIIGSLPEMTDDQNNKAVVDTLHQLLQEDPTIILPVMDSFSNLNLDELLHEQVVTIALTCIRTIDADSMPHLLRFLLLSAKPSNVRRIISEIRDQLKFVGGPNTHKSHNSKLKGKLVVDTAEASILGALRSSLRFKMTLCEEVLKELKSLEKAKDHKVIDIWLLVLVYMNGELMRKSVEKLFKRKVMEGSISTDLLDKCILGNKDLAKEYFSVFLSLSEYFLASKEQELCAFGSYMYALLFGEFGNPASRQEILGALIAHLGSGLNFEVNAALDTLLRLASQHPEELLPLSSHINGILDFLEGFTVENLHKVYEVFSRLTLCARSSVNSAGSSIGNELLMIIRKQLGNPDVKYRSMGVIGTFKMISVLGDSSGCLTSPSQKSNCEEAVELLKLSFESCKQFPLEMVLFYDELSAVLSSKTLTPGIIEWIEKHLGDFESVFLFDLEGGLLPVKECCGGIEGELWMNLDGDISPICLNILPLLSSPLQPGSILQTLPASFLLVSRMERLANQGSLGGIDALLGCPLYLPSSKYFYGSTFQSLTEKQKDTICLSLYYACNWLRELLNAFCTQVIGKSEYTSQSIKDEIATKLLKRLRNLVYLESLLNYALRWHYFIFPEVHFHVEETIYSFSNLQNHKCRGGNKIGHQKKKVDKGDHDKDSQELDHLSTDGKHCRSTIYEFKKSGLVEGRDPSAEDPNNLPAQDVKSQLAERQSCIFDDQTSVDIVGVATSLESQKFKFRSLSADCHSMLTFTKKSSLCCPDPASELPLHAYLLHDLLFKLDRSVHGHRRMKVDELLSLVKPLIPNLKKHFDVALSVLKGTLTCEVHWEEQALLAGHPESIETKILISNISGLIVTETLSLLRKVLVEIGTYGKQVLNLPENKVRKSCLLELLGGFQPVNQPASIVSDVHPIPLPGSIEYLYCGTHAFLQDALDTACSFSFKLASEVLLTLKSVVCSVLSYSKESNEKGGDQNGSVSNLLQAIQKRLGALAWKLLRHRWDDAHLDHGWKGQGERVETFLRIYLENSASTYDALEELACSAMPRLSADGNAGDHEFPTLSSATFAVWYRTLHEVNVNILNKLVRDIQFQRKPRTGIKPQSVEQLLLELGQSVNVVVSLINMCKTFNKVTVHAMMVKYAGKFLDSFLRVFDFLRVHFAKHRKQIVQLVNKLQMATKMVQTICFEAKGSKHMSVTGKVPVTKRSMERFSFHVKSLLHAMPCEESGTQGLCCRVASPQAYNDGSGDNDPNMSDLEGQPCSIEAER
ncbi:hypothetical protein Droror1_Dr00019617 [Drosera rotundifolia]